MKLVIDLQDKVLAINDNAGIKAGLANKPLCFYLALIEFCVEHPDVTLNQNKDVPDELIEHSQLKEIYYPPKAHGEGSRSRLHSYGLSNIKADDIEVIGK